MTIGDRKVYEQRVLCAWNEANPAAGRELITEVFKKICGDIYDQGFKDGQVYASKIRSMLFIDDSENPGKQKAVFPGDPDYPDQSGVLVTRN